MKPGLVDRGKKPKRNEDTLPIYPHFLGYFKPTLGDNTVFPVNSIRNSYE